MIVDPIKASRQPDAVMVVGSSSVTPSDLKALIHATRLVHRIDAVLASDSHCSAKAVIVNPLGEILILTPSDGDWADLPGGRVHDGEDAVTGLAREVREETGLSIGDIRLSETVAFRDKQRVPRTTLLYKATALTLDVQLSDEHKDFRWVKPSELAGLKLGFLAEPVRRTLDPATISASTPVGHEFRGNQFTKNPSNQLETHEIDGALAKLKLLPRDTEGDYAKAYNQSSIKLEHIGLKKSGWKSTKYHNDEGGRLSHISSDSIHFNPDTQDATAAAGIESYARRMPDPKKDGWPEVAKVGDKHHILSGHTRIAAAILGGRSHVRVKVFNYNDDGTPAKVSVKAAEATGRFMTEAELLNHPSHHETARRAAERIWRAAVDDWLSDLNAKILAAIFGSRDKDYHGVWAPVFDAAVLGWAATVDRAARTSYRLTAQTLGHDAGVVNEPSPEALEAFASARGRALERFPVAVREKLAASVQRGLEGHEDGRAIGRRVGEALEQVHEGAGRRVAATEAQVVYGRAQSEALDLAGFKLKRWETMGDDRVRDSHYLCESQGWIPVGESFQNGLRFPGDENGPPEEVINCRCNLVGSL